MDDYKKERDPYMKVDQGLKREREREREYYSARISVNLHVGLKPRNIAILMLTYVVLLCLTYIYQASIPISLYRLDKKKRR